MQMLRVWLLAACAVAFGCSERSNQVLTGHVDTTQDAVAVRAVSGDAVVTAAAVRSDGSFTLVLPAGTNYRLELLTRTGAVKHLAASASGQLREVAFKVCAPVDPYDMGGVGDPGKYGGTDCQPGDPNCKCDPNNGTCPPPPKCDPTTDPKCPPPPPPCSDPSDPNCKCDPSNGTVCPPPSCGGPNEPPCPCDPTKDPNCAPGCGGTNQPPCKCDPSTDPNCPPPPPPGTDPSDPNCKCANSTDPGCAPPCPDPTDPNSCKDPCVEDPSTCGCKAGDPNCWPNPDPCKEANGCCKQDESVTSEHAPGDFGCKESGSS
jgi:hypothetical protein